MNAIPTRPSVSSLHFQLIAVCFMLSGFAALIFGTVWLRQIALILGTSEHMQAIVLCSCLGGLAFGSAIAARLVDRITRPLWTYGLLSAGIAVSALAIPVGLVAIGTVQMFLFGGSVEPQPAGSLGRVLFLFVSIFLLLLLPTTMMGASLPLLTKHVVGRDEELGWRVAVLYAFNSFGAGVGALAIAFWCLPDLGLSRTIWVGIAANLAVFGFVWLIGVPLKSKLEAKSATVPVSNKRIRWLADRDEPATPPFSTGPDVAPQQLLAAEELPGVYGSWDRWIVCLVAVSGGVFVCQQIVFTRMLSHILSDNMFAFATMLSGILLGIAMGGAVAIRFARTRSMAAVGFAYAQCGAAICSVAAYQIVEWLASWSLTTDLSGSTLHQYMMTALVALMPTAICVGATFPLAVRLLAGDEAAAARSAARVYFWYTVGGVVGVLLTSIYVLPGLGYQGAMLITIFASVTLGLATILVFQLKVIHLLLVAATLNVILVLWPSVPINVMQRSALVGREVQGKLMHWSAGRFSTVALFGQRGSFQVDNNGLFDVSVPPTGSERAAQGAMVWLSALPPLVRPQCESMLIIGLGEGIAAGNVPPSVKSVDVLELEPAVVDANRLIGVRRDHDPMTDPRVKIVFNDGRNGLQLTTKKYHAIVLQSSHPWTASASHLFTREFVELAKDHLTDDGIFLQRVRGEFVDREAVRSIVATLLDVFPNVRLYVPGSDELLFVSSGKPIEPENVLDAEQFIVKSDRQYYRELGVRTPSDLYAALRLDLAGAKEFSAGANLITDDNNLFAATRSRGRGVDAADHVRGVLDSHRPVMRSAERSQAQCPTLDVAAILKLRSWDFSQEERIELATRIQDPVEKQIRDAVDAKLAGDRELWASTLRDVCNQYPGDSRAAFMLLADHFTGSKHPLSLEQQQELGTYLDTKYTRLLEAIVAGMGEHLSVVRQRESFLAAVEPEDPAFGHATRLRSYWRLKVFDVDYVALAEEAIQIANSDSRYVDAFEMAWFRTAGGTLANRPLVALASTQELAEEIEKMLDGKKSDSQKTFSKLVGILRLCRHEIDDREHLKGVPESRYREVRGYVDDILERCRPAESTDNVRR